MEISGIMENCLFQQQQKLIKCSKLSKAHRKIEFEKNGKNSSNRYPGKLDKSK